MRLSLPPASVTGVGSLPYRDASQAMGHLKKLNPALPYCPELPRYSPGEGMLARVARDATESVCWPPFIAHLKTVRHDAFPWAKVQIVGPSTAGAFLGRSSELYRHIDEVASARIQELNRIGLGGVAQFDEPALADGGAEGLDALRNAIASADSAGAVTMLHCCNRIEKSPGFFDTGATILSFDSVLNDPDLWLVEKFRAHFDAGGWIAWGVVPTDYTGGPTDEIERHAMAWWTAMDREILAAQSLLTPACGLATREETAVEAVFAACETLAKRLRAPLTE